MRVLSTVLAVSITAFGLIAWAALPALPVIGVALATAAFVVSSVTSRLSEPVCRDCGADLRSQASGTYGTICPHCGLVNPLDFPRHKNDQLA